MIDVMQELILADNPPTQDTFNSPSWTLLDLMDLYEITPWDYATVTKRAFTGPQSALFDQIKIFLAVEIANRSASIVRKAIDPDYDHDDWTADDDRYWFGGGDMDSDPYDVDVDGPGF